ncbi:MAG TPA: hypothetical protein VN580_00035, partial [Clostridia bacterium]|nr:hypothetical protein [Clostridia bacterium]
RSEVMYKLKKATALFMSLVVIFAFALQPVTAYAGAPSIKTPEINAPGAKPPVVKPPATAPVKKLEAPARVQGVTYEFKDEVKKVPSAMQYDFKPLSLDKFASFEKGENENELSLDKIDGI